MVKTREIKEIREIKSKVKIIKEIERERNNNENNHNSFEVIENFRFLNTRKKTLNKNKVSEKLDSIIDNESIKDENKAKDDLFKSRDNLDERGNEPRSAYTKNEGNSVYNARNNKNEDLNARYSTETPNSNLGLGFIRENEMRDRDPNEQRYSVSTDERQDNRRKKASQFG